MSHIAKKNNLWELPWRLALNYAEWELFKQNNQMNKHAVIVSSRSKVTQYFPWSKQISAHAAKELQYTASILVIFYYILLLISAVLLLVVHTSIFAVFLYIGDYLFFLIKDDITLLLLEIITPLQAFDGGFFFFIVLI